MIIGYLKVSTTEQNLDLQRDALKRAECERVIEDTVSGGKVQRPGAGARARCARIWGCAGGLAARPAGRSLKHLIELMGELEAKRIPERH